MSSLIQQNSISYIKAPITNRQPDAAVSLETIHNAILTNEHYKRLTLEYRAILANPDADEKTKRIFKAQKFDFVTTSGTFSYISSKSLIAHSNFICIDIDKIMEVDELQKLRKTLLEDTNLGPSMALLFVSPSGVGVKWVLHFKYTDFASHLRVFTAISSYILNRYGVEIDQACKDISRACFLAWDPEAILRPDPVPISQDFIELWAPQEVKFDVSEQKMKGGDETPWEDFNIRGSVHELLLENGYTVVKDGPGDDATYYLRPGHTGGSPHSLKVFKDTGHVQVHSSNCAPLEPGFHTKAQVYAKLKAKGDWKVSAKLLKAEGYGSTKETMTHERISVISSSYFPKGVPIFWELQKVGKRDVCSINPRLYVDFLTEGLNIVVVIEKKGKDNKSSNLGAESKTEDTIKRLAVAEDKILYDISWSDIPRKVDEYLLKHIAPYNRSLYTWIYNTLYNFEGTNTHQKLAARVKSVEVSTLEDTKTHSYLFYANGYLAISAEGEEFFPYSALDFYIWEKQIKKREWRGRRDYSDLSYFDFCKKITGGNEDKFNMLRQAYGYLIYTWKSKVTSRAIALIDEKFDVLNPGAANGGTGKSLAIAAIKVMRNTLEIDGKRFNAANSFSMSALEPHHKIIFFNDLKKDFEFSSIYTMVTDDITTEKKFVNQDVLPFSAVPKLVITTNYLPADNNEDSSKRRQIVIEVAPYFGPNYTPYDEYGEEFFTDWGVETYGKFDSFMVDCVIYYLKNRDLAQVSLHSVPFRDYVNKVPLQELRDYFDENIKFDTLYLNKDLIQGKLPIDTIKGFRTIYPYLTDYKNQNIGMHLKAWAEVHGHSCKSARGTKGERGWIITKTEKSKEIKKPPNEE